MLFNFIVGNTNTVGGFQGSNGNAYMGGGVSVDTNIGGDVTIGATTQPKGN